MIDYKIKVCGMRDSANIAELAQLPIDYIGFIFYPPSPRYAGDILEPSAIKTIPANIKKVGVFVNATLNEVERTAEKFGLNCIQLHGSEIPDYCIVLKEKGFTVIKAFKAEPEALTCETAAYRYSCDYFLFDTPNPKHGGSGQKFNWEILKQQKLSIPFFLSGGIALEDAEIIKDADLPGLYAIDLNSRFEIEPGLKDVSKIRTFLQTIDKFPSSEGLGVGHAKRYHYNIIPYEKHLTALAKKLRQNMTMSEVLLWNHLKQKKMFGYDFDRQRPINKYIVDFFCKELLLAVEIDGSSHGFKKDQDVERQSIIETYGITFLRFTDLEVKKDINNVIRVIENWIKNIHLQGGETNPPLPLLGGEISK